MGGTNSFRDHVEMDTSSSARNLSETHTLEELLVMQRRVNYAIAEYAVRGAATRDGDGAGVLVTDSIDSSDPKHKTLERTKIPRLHSLQTAGPEPSISSPTSMRRRAL